MADAPIAVAMGKGFFKEQGIEIEIQRFKSGTDMIAPLAAGQVDVGTGGISPGFVNAVERGLKLRAVASKAAGSNGRGHNVLVGRTDLVKNGQLKGFEDLKGKKVGINALWSTAQYVLAKLQKQKGIIYDKDYELVILNTSDMTTALANKAIDVASIFEPISTRMEDLGVGVKWKRLDEIVPELQIAVVLYGGNFAEGRPEVGKRFMVAYLQGVRYLTDAYYKENKGAKWQEVKQMLVKVIPEVDKPELYDKVYLPDYSPNGKMFEQNMMDQMEWFKANGKIKDVIPLNQLVNYSFVDYALKQLGEYK
ncbi:MAG: ABC transporter substrate-binding protein [Chloroflexi bacterium]|nr:ABC transporter substrate-binding protein [Chloroflexota bacterium]